MPDHDYGKQQAAEIEEAWRFPLEKPNGRCPYCGGKCRGVVCRFCRDLPSKEPWRV